MRESIYLQRTEVCAVHVVVEAGHLARRRHLYTERGVGARQALEGKLEGEGEREGERERERESLIKTGLVYSFSGALLAWCALVCAC